MGRFQGSAVLTVGSHAARTCEPRQVRKKATVSGSFWVPQGRLVGAMRAGKLWGGCQRRVHGLFIGCANQAPTLCKSISTLQEVGNIVNGAITPIG